MLKFSKRALSLKVTLGVPDEGKMMSEDGKFFQLSLKTNGKPVSNYQELNMLFKKVIGSLSIS